MTLDEMQNMMLVELDKFHPKSANLFEITQVIIKESHGTTPDGPPFARLIEDKYISATGDGIGFYKITAKGRKFIADGGYQKKTNSADNKKIYPSFKPYDWDEKNNFLCKPLLSSGNVKADIPLIAYGHDTPEIFEFINLKETNSLSIEQAHSQALEQIKEIDIKLQEYNGKEFKMLICSGNYFAAEKILDPAFMKEAQKKLKASMLAVSLPRKGTMYITNGILPAESIAMFAAMTKMKYAENESTPPLSTTLFTVQDGELVGIIKLNSTGNTNPLPEKKGFWSRLFGKD